MRCALPKNLAFLIFFKGRNSTQCFVTIFSGEKSWTFFSLQSKLWMCWLIWVHATIIWEKPRQLIVNERHKSLGNRCIMPLQLHRNCLACLRNYWIFFLQIDAIRSKSTIKKVFKGKMPFRSSFYWVSKQVLNTILNIFSMLKKVRWSYKTANEASKIHFTQHF